MSKIRVNETQKTNWKVKYISCLFDYVGPQYLLIPEDNVWIGRRNVFLKINNNIFKQLLLFAINKYLKWFYFSLYFYHLLIKILSFDLIRYFCFCFFRELLRSQNNLSEHDPNKCSKNFNLPECAKKPQFSAAGPKVFLK